MTEFSLPPLQQDSFSTYYGQKIDRSDNGVETVVYPGKKLSASSKSRALKKHISPSNVFITKIEYSDGRPDEFAHKLFGNDNQWATLPKRLYSVCFPKIHLGSIPKNNRITLQLTDSIHQELPYVPDEFYKQKQQKAHRPTKPVTRRNKRQRVSIVPSNESEIAGLPKTEVFTAHTIPDSSSLPLLLLLPLITATTDMVSSPTLQDM